MEESLAESLPSLIFCHSCKVLAGISRETTCLDTRQNPAGMTIGKSTKFL